MNKALNHRHDVDDCVCQEKKEEDLQAFKIAMMHPYSNSKTTYNNEDYSHQKQYRQHKHQQNKNNQETKMWR